MTSEKGYRWLLRVALVACAILPRASASTLWSNPLPTGNLNNAAGGSRSNVAPVYGNLPDVNLGGSPSQPYSLGDQFLLSTEFDITSITIYEVGNSPSTSPLDPTQEFSNISLYLGPDHLPLSFITSAYTFQQVQYNGATDYESVGTPGAFFPIYAITFSGLNVALGPGLQDFDIQATPIGGNTFALLMSDPSNSGPFEASFLLSPNGFLYFFNDGPGSTPLATYQYAPNQGDITGYNNGADANVLIQGQSVPEPSTLGMLGLGLAGVWVGIRRRRVS